MSHKDLVQKSSSIEMDSALDVQYPAVAFDPVRRSFERWRMNNIEHENFGKFTNYKVNGPAIHTIFIHNTLIDVYFKPNVDSDVLMVFFNAANTTPQNSKITFPVFSGLGISKHLNCSIASISDSSLHLSDDLRLAWYIGCRNLDLTPVCADLIRHLIEISGAKRVILVGGSGGGFAALNVGHLISGSLVIAANPQTDIAMFFKPAIDLFAQICFDKAEFSEIEDHIREERRMCLNSIYSAGFDNYVIYIQNLTDPHLSRHAMPFFNAIGQNVSLAESIAGDRAGLYRATDQAVFGIGHWGKGHVVPPEGAMATLLKQCSANNISTANFFEFKYVDRLLRELFVDNASVP